MMWHLHAHWTPIPCCDSQPALTWLYHALMESSEWQLRSEKGCLSGGDDMADARQLRRATGRHFAKSSPTWCLRYRYIMAGFTERKQALHDMIAGCLCCGETMKKSVEAQIRSKTSFGIRNDWRKKQT